MPVKDPAAIEPPVRYGQFYIGPSIPETIAEWPVFNIGNSLCLLAHPQLQVTQASLDESRLTLIGYLLDPDHPGHGNDDILRSLADARTIFQDPFSATRPLGGRWLIIVQRQGETIIFADPAGLRQLFYTDIGVTKEIHCASEPGLLAKVCGFSVDRDAEDFLRSPGVRADSEYWWPGDKSCFREVRRLLPNFSLDPDSGTCKRFWPAGPFKPVAKKAAIELLGKRLPAFMDAISRRGKIAVSLTAGLDSRMVLAACKSLLDRFEFMTVQQEGMPDSHPDLQIPRVFASKFGFRHTIVGSKCSVRDSFRRSYEESILDYHEKWLPDAQSIYDQYKHSSVVVVGSMAETARLFYERLNNSAEPVTPLQLARAARLGDHPFAVDAFADWLNGAENIFNYDVADLFYWEQRAGRWMATSQLEFGMAWQDIYTPFNSREILEVMLSVDPQHRRAPGHELFTGLIKHLWPKLLSRPINPHEMPAKSALVVRIARKIKRQFNF